jgi:beta-lactam-binding protein with PASTA domain
MKICISDYENYTIEKLISLLKQNGIKKNDEFSFEFNYDDCYYEGDAPSIVIKPKDKKNISKK